MDKYKCGHMVELKEDGNFYCRWCGEVNPKQLKGEIRKWILKK